MPDPKVNILLVDDQPENLLALEGILQDLGQNLVKAGSGKEALRRLLSDDFAVVLLDVQMPDMDGFETAELIRSRERTKHTPIVFLSAVSREKPYVTRGYSVGAVDYVVKPFEPDALRAKVATFVELTKQREALREEVAQRERAEAEVRQLNEDLERRVARRTAELEAANRQLQDEIRERIRAEERREELLAREESARAAAEAAAQASEELLHALRASEQQHRALAEAIPHMVWIARTDGHIEFFNRRWHEYTGLSPEESLGFGWERALHPDDRERCLQDWRRIVRSGRELNEEYRFRRADGRYRWHLGRAVPLRDDRGEVTRWFGTCTDIQDQKRVQQSLAFLAEASKVLSESLDYEATLDRVARLAVPQVADWCMVDIVDPDGSIRRLAASHSDPEAEQRGRELWQRYPPGPQEDVGLVKVLRTGCSELFTEMGEDFCRTVARDDEHFRLLSSFGIRSGMVVPLLARGRTLGAISLLMAESGRRCTEEDLVFAEDLARRAAFAIDNIRLLREVQEADRAKDEFLAMLGHELRNPLTPIRNAVQVLHLHDHRDPKLARARQVVERQVRHMSRLVDDLLDVSRITRGRIELRKAVIDLTTVAELAADSSRQMIEERGHAFELSLPPQPVWVEADPTRVEQVIVNLLSNAAKYTEPGGRIALSVEVEGKRERAEGPLSSAAVVKVRDTGIGIDPKVLRRIFEPFAQADRSLDRSQGGLGLGLTLVKRLVELHGGAVTVSSDGIGRGAEFAVHLPALEGVPAVGSLSDTAPVPEGEAGKGRRRVLVVEDNPDAAETLADLLDLWGHEVRMARDGLQAIEIAAGYYPEVVLLDIGLPGIDGYEVARRLREIPQTPLTPPRSKNGGKAGPGTADEGPGTADRRPLLIALTGYGQEEDRRLSREAGFDVHLTKPVDPEYLRRLIAGDLVAVAAAG
jgi:PAS domain S-box-containing protein